MEVKSLQEKLDALLKECEQFRVENSYLKELIRQVPILPCSKIEPERPTAGFNLTAIDNGAEAGVGPS